MSEGASLYNKHEQICNEEMLELFGVTEHAIKTYLAYLRDRINYYGKEEEGFFDKDRKSIFKYERVLEKLRNDVAKMQSPENSFFIDRHTNNIILSRIANAGKTALQILIYSIQEKNLSPDFDNSDCMEYQKAILVIDGCHSVVEAKQNILIDLKNSGTVIENQKKKKWPERIQKALEKLGALATFSEILDSILDDDPKLLEVNTELKLRSKLSGTLKYYSDTGFIKRMEVNGEDFGFVYGMSAWYDKNNKVIEKYKTQKIK